MNATIDSKGTLLNNTSIVSHIGQLFYPTALRDAVEELEPFASNTIAVSTNDEDQWSVVPAGTTYDTYPEFVHVGDSLSDGLFAWIQIGINSTADYINEDYYAVAAYYTADDG